MKNKRTNKQINKDNIDSQENRNKTIQITHFSSFPFVVAHRLWEELEDLKRSLLLADAGLRGQLLMKSVLFTAIFGCVIF